MKVTQLKNSIIRQGLIVILTSLLFTSVGLGDDDNADQSLSAYGVPLEVEASVGYESLYMDDGIQEGSNGIFVAEFEAEAEFDFGEVFFELEALTGETTNVTEIEWALGFQRELFADINGYIGYSWTRESPDSEGLEDEMFLGFTYDLYDWVSLDLGVTRALDYNGSLYHFAAEKTIAFNLLGLPLDITPEVAAYYDDDYVSEGDSNLNHIQAAIGAEWEIFDDASLELKVSHVWVQKNLYELRRAEESGDDDNMADDMTNGAGVGDMMGAMGDNNDAGEEEEAEDEKIRNDTWVGISVIYEF